MEINNTDIKFNSIKDKNELLNIVKNSEPDKNNDIGFWLFDEAFKKDDSYLNINNKPFYPVYIAFYVKDNIVALCSISLLYYKKYQKIKKYQNFAKILDFQTDSKYKGNNLQNKCMKIIQNQLKNKIKGWVKVPYNNQVLQKYLKDGFILDNDNNVMYKEFNKPTNESLIENIIKEYFKK